MISKDTAGATSSDPRFAQPQAKDVLATLESLENFMLLAASKDPETTDMEFNLKSEAKTIKEQYSNWKGQFQAILTNPETSNFTVATLSELRNQIETTTNALRVANVLSGSPAPLSGSPAPLSGSPAPLSGSPAKPIVPALDVKPTVVAAPPGVITLNELQELRERVKQEVLRLANLRSSSPTLTNRLAHLESLAADVSNMITTVERGQLKIEEVPIKPDSAQAFLKQLPNTGAALPSLIAPQGKTEPKMLAPPSDSVRPSNPALQQLLQNAQYLKWSVQLNLEFNPELAQKGKLMERLEKMEKRLTHLAISETPLPLPPSPYRCGASSPDVVTASAVGILFDDDEEEVMDPHGRLAWSP